MLRQFIAKRRARAWRKFREQFGPRSAQGRIRDAERSGDFKFMRVWMWCILLQRKAGYRNTWEAIGRFATRWAARTHAMELAKSSGLTFE